MKYVKSLGAVAMAAAALMVWAGPASATFLTSPEGVTYTGNVKFELESEAMEITGPTFAFSCSKSSIEMKVEQHGATVTVAGKVVGLEFGECNFPVKILKAGSLEIHTAGAGSNGNGKVTWTGGEITINTPTFNCIYSTNNTSIGTLTGNNTGNATHHLENSSISRTGHSALCGGAGIWSGNYKVTTPNTLYVH